MYYQHKYKHYYQDPLFKYIGYKDPNPASNFSYITTILSEGSIPDDYITLTNILEKRIKGLCDEISAWFDEFRDFVIDKSIFYQNFKIPKKKGGFREIDAPLPALKHIQKEILNVLQGSLEMVPHNSAYAYLKNRSTLSMAEKIKSMNCIIKMDLTNFFNSITKELLYEKLGNIYNFNYLKNYLIPNWTIEGKQANLFDAIIYLATKDDHLVQGNPLSPFLSNFVMLEFDHKITQAIKEGLIPRYTYTRYADDLFFSDFAFADTRKVIDFVDNLLETCYHNCIKRNKEKTQFLKCTKKCYITGVKLNKDHKLTYGHENKKKLKLKLYNLFIKYDNNEATIDEVQELIGQFSYMKSIEPNYADYLERKLLSKFNSTATTLGKHFKF